MSQHIEIPRGKSVCYCEATLVLLSRKRDYHNKKRYVPQCKSVILMLGIRKNVLRAKKSFTLEIILLKLPLDYIVVHGS